MRTFVFAFLCAATYLFIACCTVIAAEQPDMQQILKKLDEVIQRNNDLAKQNEELAKKVQRLEKQVTGGAAVPQKIKSDDEISILKERVKTLEQQGPAKENAEVASLKEDVGEMSAILQNVERKTLLDRVQMGVELRTRCDWFSLRERVKTKSLFGKTSYHHNSDKVQALCSNRFRLNMKAEIADNLVFNGRMVVYKNWTDDPYEDPQNDANRARYPGSSDVKLERAYVDYFFTPHPLLPLALSFGRFPTTDGMPTEFRENTARKSTYPALAYDYETDGAGVSFMLENLTGLKNSALRFLYGRSVSDNDYQIYRHADWYDGHLDEQDVYVAQFETETIKNSLFIINYFYSPEFSQPDVSFKGVNPVKLSSNLGSYSKLTFFFEAKKFLDSNFDWFAGYAQQWARADGKATWGLGPIPLQTIGLITNGESRERNAHAWQIGMRYNIPWETLNLPKVGVEFNTGSKYWLGLNGGAEDPLRKLTTRGNAWDFYYIQPITSHFMIRLGHTYVDQRHSYSPFGTPERLNTQIRNTYLLLDANF